MEGVCNYKTSVNPRVNIGSESFPDPQPCSNSEHKQKNIKWRWDTIDPITPEMFQNVCNRKRKLLDPFFQRRKTAMTLTKDKILESQWEIPSGSITNEAENVICLKKNKYLKGQGSCKVLIKCNMLREDAQMWNASVKKMSNRSFTKSGKQIILAEVHYR